MSKSTSKSKSKKKQQLFTKEVAKEILEQKKFNFCKDLKYALELKLDNTHDNKVTTRFTFGRLGDPISGAVFINRAETVPGILLLLANISGKDGCIDVKLPADENEKEEEV